MQAPFQRYEADIASGHIQPDSAQQKAVGRLDKLFKELVEQEQQKAGFSLRALLPFLKGHVGGIKGVYLWGGVGRGKTYLMDLFYEALPFDAKLRTHFHRFMRGVHEALTQQKGHKNPLDQIAKDIAQQYKVICFDEFFVTDITDAMILGNLFSALFELGVVLVATSNITPDKLYENGLQRERFLPAIKLIEKHTDVINVDGGVDYRLRQLQQANLYYHPLSAQSAEALTQCCKRLVSDWSAVQRDTEVVIEGRTIPVMYELDDVIWFHFSALCDGPRSQNDYIVLACEYHAVIVSGVPFFTEQNDDQARRFVYLVDEFYDRKVKLILSAAAPIDQLYQSGKLAFEFERTQSRLLEMQSEEYLAMAHKP